MILWCAVWSSALLAQATDGCFEPADVQSAVFELMQVEAAWELVGEDDSCLVGVLDSGFDFFHPALRETLQPGYFADGVYHVDAASQIAHGTSMASLIAARRVDEGGMVGFAPRSRMIGASMGMPLHLMSLLQRSFFEQNPGADFAAFQVHLRSRTADLATFGRDWMDYVSRTASEGIRDLVARGARVINFSAFVGTAAFAAHPEFAERIDQAFRFAAEQDVLIVIGAGNSGTEVDDYPGDPATMLVVGASEQSDDRWSMEVEAGGTTIRQGSCFGPRLSVLAPMENLRTARPHEPGAYGVLDTPMGSELSRDAGPYEVAEFGATSMATAVASSLAALVRAVRPDLDVATVVRVIQAGAVDLGEPGWDPLTGHGRIDFLATLELTLDEDEP